jgi:hypothetical protein
VFGPVRGTSAGIVGCVGRGGPLKVELDDVGGWVVIGTVVCGAVSVRGGGLEGVVPLDADEQAALASARNAAIVQIGRTS